MKESKNIVMLELLISNLYKTIRAERNEYFKRHSLTPPQYDVLSCLYSGNMTLSDISETLLLDSSTLVGVVDRLMDKDWVLKKVSPKDRRKNILSLSDKGKEQYESISTFISPTLTKLFEDIDESEQDSFFKTLDKIIGKMGLSTSYKVLTRDNLKPVRV
ncbi:MAG: MarR family winged helix-turn-helix transcriptional regulator [Vulcanimicrobiota bacterium]